MIKRKSIFIAFMAAAILSGCSNAKASNNEARDQSSSVSVLLDNEFKKHYSDVVIDGRNISLPYNYEKFIGDNFIGSTDAAIKIEKGTPILETITDNDNNSISAYIGYNGRGESGFKTDSKIISIYASRDNAGEMDIEFYKGINFESSEAEIAKILDYVQSDNGNSLYAINLDKYDYLSVSFHNGEVHDIMVIRGSDFFE
jgi:hypothetical protein